VAFAGRAVLFIEGELTPHPRGPDFLRTIWQQHLVESLGLIHIERIVPINKKNLVAMDKAMLNMVSGMGIVPLDELIARELRREEFDVAVVAWDLQPRWGTPWGQTEFQVNLKLGLTSRQESSGKQSSLGVRPIRVASGSDRFRSFSTKVASGSDRFRSFSTKTSKSV